MQIIFRKSFQKDFAKCSAKVRLQAEERVALFMKDRFYPLLNFHGLKGDYEDFFSINVNADIRIVFYLTEDIIHLVRIGTHSQLYD